MTTIVAIFEHVCSKELGCENLEKMISFFDVDTEADVLEQIKRDFKTNTKAMYGEYGRSYVFQGYGEVVVGRSFLLKPGME